MLSWLLKAMSHTEWKMASLGIAVATSSAVFAVYMVSHSDEAPGLTVSEHFMIFARPSTTRREPFMKFAPPPTEVASQETEVDTTPVGSIGPKPQLNGEPSTSSPPVVKTPKQLPGYFVRGAFDGKVLVQSPTGFELVGLGDKIADAGPVLSIKYDKGRWVVMTEAGSISSSAPN